MTTALYLVPAVAIGIAFVWLGEIPGWIELAGGAIALAGVALANTRHRAAGPVARPPVTLQRSGAGR